MACVDDSSLHVDTRLQSIDLVMVGVCLELLYELQPKTKK